MLLLPLCYSVFFFIVNGLYDYIPLCGVVVFTHWCLRPTPVRKITTSQGIITAVLLGLGANSNPLGTHTRFMTNKFYLKTSPGRSAIMCICQLFFMSACSLRPRVLVRRGEKEAGIYCLRMHMIIHCWACVVGGEHIHVINVTYI